MGHVVNPYLFRLNYVLFWSTSLVVKKKYAMYFEVNSIYILKYLQNYFKKYEFITMFRLYNSNIKLIYLNNTLKIFLLFNQSKGFKRFLKKKVNKKLIKSFKAYIKKTLIKFYFSKNFKNTFLFKKKKLVNTKKKTSKLNSYCNADKTKFKFGLALKNKKFLKTNIFFLKKKEIFESYFFQTNLNKKLLNINKIKYKEFSYKKKSRKYKLSNFNVETKNLFIENFSFKQAFREKFQILSNNVYAFPYPKRKIFFMYKKVANFFNFKNKFLKLNKKEFVNSLKEKNLTKNKIPITLNFNRIHYLKRKSKKKNIFKAKKQKKFYRINKRFLRKVLENLNGKVSNFLMRSKRRRKIRKKFLNKVCIPAYFEIKKLNEKKTKVLRLIDDKKIYNNKKFIKKKYLAFKNTFNIRKELMLNFNGSFSRMAFESKIDETNQMNPAIFNTDAFVRRLHIRRQALHHFKALEKIRLSYSMILLKKKYFRGIFSFLSSIYNYSQKDVLKLSYNISNKILYLKKFNNGFKINFKKYNKAFLKNSTFKKVKKFKKKKKKKKKSPFKKASFSQYKKKFKKIRSLFGLKRSVYKAASIKSFKLNYSKQRYFFLKNNRKVINKTLRKKAKTLFKSKKKFKKNIVKYAFDNNISIKKWKYNKNFNKNFKRKQKKSLRIKTKREFYEKGRINQNSSESNNKSIGNKYMNYKFKSSNFFLIHNYAKNFVNKFFSFFYYSKISKLKLKLVSALNVLFNYKINLNFLIIIKKHWSLFCKSADLIADLFILKLLQKFKINAIMNSVLNYLNKCIKKKKLYGYAILIMGRFSRKDRATYSWYKKGPFSRSNKLVFIDYSNKRVALRFSTCSFKINLIKSLDYKEKKNEIL